MSTDQAPIVVGVDGSRASDRAVRYAAGQAALRKAPLRVICAYTWPPNLSALPMYIAVPGVDIAELRKSAERTAETAVAQAMAVAEDVEIDGAAIEGMTPSVLVAESAHARLVVVGSRQLRAVGSFVLGSVGDAVATHAACPVVVTRGDQDSTPADGAIVIGIDYADAPDALLRFGFDEAAVRAAPLRVVLCWHPDLGTSSRLLRQAADEARLLAEVWLSDALIVWRNKYPDVIVDARLVDDHPVVGLIEQSAGQQLLVVGSHDRNALAATLLGSVSRGVLHHATCPVAVVPIKG
jgi:nucleotide-binding universal stress UspA family protein